MRRDRRVEVRPEIGYAWRRLRETRGGVGVAELAAETGLSARRLGSLFRAEIGLAPKEAGRVFRFTARRRRIGRAGAGRRARHAARPRHARRSPLAVECGFYDQAHLAREFRALAAARRRSGWPRSSDSSKPRPLTSGNDRGMTQTPPPQVWPRSSPATPAG